MSKKGYKAFKLKDGKMYCVEVQYMIGATYEQTGKIKPCRNGLHYCKDLLNVGNYYDYGVDTIICEVEDIGEISIDNCDKTVTNKLKIIKEINKEEYPFRYDDKGNIIYKKYMCEEFYSIYEYDNNDNIVYINLPYENFSCHYKYDKNGNMIYMDASNTSERHYKYDENNNRIYAKLSNGTEFFYEYDKNGNMTHKRNSHNETWTWRYDEDGNNVYYCRKSNIPGYKEYKNEHFYKYDVNNKLIRKENHLGEVWEYKYDNRGNLIYEKYPDGKTYVVEYDEDNNIIYSKEPNDIEHHRE